MTVVFDNAGHASVAGNIRVYHYFRETGEYRGWSDEYIPVGVSLPGCSTTIEPGADIDGHVWVFDGTEWISQENHRGETVFSTETGAPQIVNYIGAIRDGYVSVVPATEFDQWNGKKWVTNLEAQHAAAVQDATIKRSALRVSADAEIAWLGDAVDADIATENEKKLLAEWKKYRVLLMRISLDDAPAIEWPPVPDGAADVEV